VKTAVSLPDPVFEPAERLADRLGVNRSRLYALALERYLDEADTEVDPMTAKLDEIYGRGQHEPDVFVAEAARRLVVDEHWE